LSKLSQDFTEEEHDTVEELTVPGAPIIYEVISQEGEEELQRPFKSLFWAGIAAGLLISLSVYAEASLRAGLGDVAWRGLVENLGYSVGFVVVVLGRLQLFTENTITTVAPLLITPSWIKLQKTARLWLIVFIANMIGTFIAAAFFHFLPVATPEIATAFGELSRHIFEFSLIEKITKGILAGVIIATMVWVLPNARSSAFWVIVLFTYFIALGDLTHVVAGAVEAFYAALQNDVSFYTAIVSYILPTLLGNVLGGTFVFTLLVYAQIVPEVES